MPHALITGTSSGFGLLTAERLTDLGWTVTGAMRNPARAKDETRWETVEIDLTQDDSIEAVAAHVGERYGRLDALVSNAGFGVLGPWEEVAAHELRHQLEVNLVGTIMLCRACLPWLRVAGGAIVQVSSVAGQSGDELFGPYNASKFGLEGATEALRLEVEPQGIRCVIVEPGPFRTTIVESSPRIAARGSSGRYQKEWQELDEWVHWLATESPEAGEAVDAIVAAVIDPAAPFRIPVGEDAAEGVREHAEGVIADVARSEEFLRSHGTK